MITNRGVDTPNTPRHVNTASPADVLNRVDNALSEMCPCGGTPRPGSPYCSYDCEPTHVAADTDPRQTGVYATPMRWRPDLVNASDDTNLTRIDTPGDRHGYIGPYNPSVYEHTNRPAWHLRLDNGHRYAGCDIHTEDLGPDGIIPAEMVERIRATWVQLERELDNTRHLEPDDDPWADSHPVAEALRADLARHGRVWVAALDRWVAERFNADHQADDTASFSTSRDAASQHNYCYPIMLPPLNDPRSLFRNINIT